MKELQNLPEKYRHIFEAELEARIAMAKAKMGPRLVILTHHYQRPEIVAEGDFLGDSLQLCRDAAASREAEKIIFCGVHFMAEAAEILSLPHQKVYLANPDAGCSLADSARLEDVKQAWQELNELYGNGKITPCVYINSSADIKAFCGLNNGLTCTSANAGKALAWALKKTEKAFFFPDQHLGRNTAYSMEIKGEELAVWKPGLPLGGNSPESLNKARVILWDGFCCVHMHFTPEMIENVRRKYPGIKVIVHPECRAEVAEAADFVGSTTAIINYLKGAPAGSIIAVGTENSMVQRVAAELNHLKIMNLSYGGNPLCGSMHDTTLNHLLYTLENMENMDAMRVNPETAEGALKALNRMLEL